MSSPERPAAKRQEFADLLGDPWDFYDLPASPDAASAPIVTVLFTETADGWVDPGDAERRAVTSCCRVCGVTEDDVRKFEVLVSPQGVAHFSDDFGTGDTKCGKDATRDAWWWPL